VSAECLTIHTQRARGRRIFLLVKRTGSVCINLANGFFEQHVLQSCTFGGRVCLSRKLSATLSKQSLYFAGKEGGGGCEACMGTYFFVELYFIGLVVKNNKNRCAGVDSFLSISIIFIVDRVDGGTVSVEVRHRYLKRRVGNVISDSRPAPTYPSAWSPRPFVPQSDGPYTYTLCVLRPPFWPTDNICTRFAVSITLITPSGVAVKRGAPGPAKQSDTSERPSVDPVQRRFDRWP